MKEIPEQDRPWHSAFHEAGHAVACCLLGIPFSYTTIAPTEEVGCPGITFTVPNENPSCQKICDEMVVLAAGMVAATLRPGADTRLLDLYLYAGADDDLEHIRNYAAHLAADRVEYEQLIDQAHLGAHKLLKTPIHRAAVIRVAEALLEKQTLDNVAVQQIIDEVSQESATTDH